MHDLESMEGATRLKMPPGQVLVYREHRSPGVFVVLSGRIEVPEERGHRRPSPHRLEALPGRPVLIPGPDSVEEPFADTWAVGDTAEVLYLPRTLVHDNPDLKKRLRELANG
jgi:quercetin dioxygenase-like cupin family protein